MGTTDPRMSPALVYADGRTWLGITTTTGTTSAWAWHRQKRIRPPRRLARRARKRRLR